MKVDRKQLAESTHFRAFPKLDLICGDHTPLGACDCWHPKRCDLFVRSFYHEVYEGTKEWQVRSDAHAFLRAFLPFVVDSAVDRRTGGEIAAICSDQESDSSA